MMNEVKKLGRPKDKDISADAERLLHVRLTAAAKQRFEFIRLCLRIEAYDANLHGAMPTALPLVRNAVVVDRILFDVTTSPANLAEWLARKGCRNAAELLGLPEGPEQ